VLQLILDIRVVIDLGARKMASYYGAIVIARRRIPIVPERPMMIMLCVPRLLQGVFASFRESLSKPQFAHLHSMVLALLISPRKAKLTHLAKAAPGAGHRTSQGRFLSESEWDAPGLLAAEAARVLRKMKPRSGETIYLLLDDVRIVKRGKKRMEGVSKLWDHAHQRYAYGHIVVVAAILFRGVVLPWRLELWLAKQWAGAGYRKLTEIAAGLIREFQPPKGLKVRVLFDAAYLCPKVTKTCQSRGFTWFSVASKNRKLTRKHAQKRSIADLAPGVLKHQGRRVRLRRSRGWRWMRVALVDGRLARIGSIRIVLSKRPRQAWKTTIAVVTNETKRDARTILAIYEKRWNIEVLFKELKGPLGLGDYQVLRRTAIVRHLHLCCLAHLVLTHHSLDAVGAQARKANTELPLPPMNQRLEALRDAVRRHHVQRFVRTIKHRNLRRRVQQYLLAA
jgi:hypothetical protein